MNFLKPVMLIALLLFCSQILFTQSDDDYWLPGAIKLLGAGKTKDFSDDRTIRAWIVGLNLELTKRCNIVPSGAEQIAYAANVLAFRASINYSSGQYGIEDADRLVQQYGCQQIEPYYHSSVLVMGLRGSQPAEDDIVKIMELGGPKVWREFKISRQDAADFVHGYIYDRDELSLSEAINHIFTANPTKFPGDVSAYQSSVSTINGQILSCVYTATKDSGVRYYGPKLRSDGSEHFHFVSPAYYFWKDQAPANLAALRARLPREHPIFLIREAQTTCPMLRPDGTVNITRKPDSSNANTSANTGKPDLSNANIGKESGNLNINSPKPRRKP